MTSPFARLAAEICFGKEAAENLDHGHCPMCGNPDPTQTLRDQLSLDEFKQSGLCQACQDDCFKP